MKNILRIFPLIMMAILLASFMSACGKPRPLTLEEQDAYMAKQQCEQFANEMNPDWQGFDNPFWNDSFISCMHEYGVPNAPLRRLWY